MANLNDKSCSSGWSRCWRKRDKLNTGTTQPFSHDSVHKKRYVDCWRRKELCFTFGSLLNETIFTATRAERLQNGKHWVLRLSLGHEDLFDSDHTLSVHSNNAWDCKMFIWLWNTSTQRIFLVHVDTLHPCARHLHGSRCCRTTCLHIRALIHVSQRVLLCVVSLRFDFLFSFHVSLFILFISSILVIILHVVGNAEY